MKNMKVEHRAVAALFTVLLHLLIWFALVHATASVVTPRPPPAVHAISAKSLRGAGEQVVQVDIGPSLATRGLACTGSSYIGIGITAEPRSERIIMVGDDTPASRAGLQHDDIVLNPAVWQHAHTEGALLRVVVLRDGVTLALPVLVGRICIG